jgi:hypothetical protein
MVHVRLSEANHRRLRVHAALDGVSLQTWIEEAVLESLDRAEAEAKKIKGGGDLLALFAGAGTKGGETKTKPKKKR